MDIVAKNAGDVTIVMLAGELDTLTAPQAKSRFDRLHQQGVRKMVLDLRKLDYITSSGLRLCHLNDTVHRVFEISGFDTLLAVFDSEADAMSGF